MFVGEGSGGSPYYFGDSVSFLAPNSGLLLQISSRVHPSPMIDDEGREIPADIPVALSSQDFFTDIDPVLDAALGAPAASGDNAAR